MKRYLKPKITLIELDPSQAVLAACKAGGIYMDNFGSPLVCVYTGTGIWRCANSNKGGPGGNTTGIGETETMPS